MLVIAWFVANFAHPIDVVLLSDPNYAIGVAAIINGVRKHTPGTARFWIGYDGDPATLLSYLSCVGVDKTHVTIRRSVAVTTSSNLSHLKVDKGKERLRSAANFARFALYKLFPELKVVWYFDTDALPVADLTAATRAFESSRAPLRPAERDPRVIHKFGHKRGFGTIGFQFPDQKAISDMYRSEYSEELVLSAPSWNAGVWLADLSKWKERDIAGHAVAWVKRRQAYRGWAPLWKLATQPLMYVSARRVQ
jgi:lipopolysaccharide biosynthesis glycosyltransferase